MSFPGKPPFCMYCHFAHLVEVHKGESLKIAFLKYALPEFSILLFVVPS